ncbi:hypothetical protein EB796_019707 [Bugula neritina]|uniref:Uncharacterized protein n=1 Tax=Bugula neritina TaxID=10212 RepID=A0A7J7J6X6_BUGNE|nr:hypothetical protein EB796_019707 [Bugula neritina]
MGEDNTTPTSSARRSSVGVGVGVTLSLIAVIVIVVVIVIFLRRRKRKPMKQCFKNREKPPPQGANGDPGVQDCDIYDLPETSVYLYSDLSNDCRRQCEPDESSANHIYSAPDDGGCEETKRLVNEDSQVYHLADEIDDTYYSVPQGTQAQEVEPQSTEPADYKVPTNNTAVGGSSLYDSPRNNTAIAHSDSVYDSPRNNQAVGAKDNNIII